MTNGCTAIVFDLFGTLVDAPRPEERTHAAAELACVLGISSGLVERRLIKNWRARHDGTLPTTEAVVEHLHGGPPIPAAHVAHGASLIRERAHNRLACQPSTLRVLRQLRTFELRIGLLSDATPDVAEVWGGCALSRHIDVAVFSCRAGAVKPDPEPFELVLARLGMPPHVTLYCGDGGGDELRAATQLGMHVIGVRTRGSADGLVFGRMPWSGRVLGCVEDLVGSVLVGGSRAR